ncbi:MAG TPA: aldo/keto reductase [Gemmatimonadaceae bacterium]|jgi:aryl-alcohol dehydrogenase-like predicted oxidoreductase|nr:aldo/keto reductase [Gemmatimonadaceae bacterium]
MKYRLLGRSGLRVSEICLGTMTFGQEWGWGSDKAESRNVFDTYVDRGGNFLDTANRYTEGTSETLVGEFIRGDRERFIVATKYSLYTTKGDPNASGNQRKNMVQAVEASLKRLGTDYIDLYYLHAWDAFTPVDEVMRAFDDLVRAGKIIYAGISDTPAWIVSQANTLADLRGWTPFVGLQIEYSLIERTVERDLIPMAAAFDLAVLPWGPLGGGLLSGKYTSTNGAHTAPQDVRLKDGSLRLTDRNLAIAAEVVRVAQEVGHTPSQVALAWLMQRPGKIIPIVGARRAPQLAETLDATEITLPAEQVKRLDAVSAIDLGFPHEWVTRDYMRENLYGGTLPLIKDRFRTRPSGIAVIP